MSYNYKKLLPKIQATIEKYGVELDVYRDTYESEVGVQTYKSTSLVTKIKGVLDNSKSFYKDLEEMGVNDYDFWKLLDKSWEDAKS